MIKASHKAAASLACIKPQIKKLAVRAEAAGEFLWLMTKSPHLLCQAARWQIYRPSVRARVKEMLVK
jgi:hypothetical protein